jgi:CRP-like cAMP-binding protein
LFLARLMHRSVLTAQEQSAILALPTRAHIYAPREDIVSMAQTTKHSCLVGEGLAARFAETASGNRQSIALHIPGDMADLHSVVSPKVVTPLQAFSRCLIYEIPHPALRRIATEYPAIAYSFWRDGIIDAAIVAQSVLNLGQRKAPARIAHVLCEIATRIGAVRPKTFSFDFAISQPQLGEVVGLHAVHVNRTLRKLKTEGLAVLDGKKATVLDWPALIERAEFDPAYLQMEPLDFHKPLP